jgi:drug/metabolite transporter (DMT)-like permease
MSGSSSSRHPGHFSAVLEALFVTALWSSSWILIKFGLHDIPALTFAGLRYFLAFLCLLPFACAPSGRAAIRRLTGRQWALLTALGVIYYALTQGTQFIGLALLPAVTASMLLNCTSAVVALSGVFLLAERPSPMQWSGVTLNLAGVLIFFYPAAFAHGEWVGIAVMVVGLAANSGSSLLGRYINRDRAIPALTVTAVSMGIGSLLMLAGGVAAQGLPALKASSWAIVVWLAVVNTALAFTLWNRTLQVLSAVESTIINSTMMIQIACLAWVFLDESLSAQKIAGLMLAGAGAILVQLRRSSSVRKGNGETVKR